MTPTNILWIITTQWRAQATGCAGDPNLRAALRTGVPLGTPCIDAFARAPGTIHFTQAVTPHPFGPFARAALLTGIPSPENGVRDYHDPLPANSRTIAHTLKERGFATAFFGKWHLSRRNPRDPLVGDAHARAIVPTGARGGFDFWEGFEGGFLLNDPWLHGTRLPEPARLRGYQSDILCDRALEYLRSSTAPQFCIVSLEAPHPPYAASAPCGRSLSPPQIILPANVPRGGEIEAQARRDLAGYYAHIEATDAAIGRLIAGARAQNPDTLIMFTSVHGDMHGAHGLFRKGWPHEESVRVPLLVSPGQNRKFSRSAAAEGKNRRRLAMHGNQAHNKAASSSRSGTALQSEAPVSLIDLPAMTLAFADQVSGAQSGSEYPDADWNLALWKTHARISMPGVVRLPHQCDRVWNGARTPARKLILNADGSPWLFFDLENDPLEMRNLAGDPARASEIAALREEIRITQDSVSPA